MTVSRWKVKLYFVDDNSCRQIDFPLHRTKFYFKCDASGGQIGLGHPGLFYLEQKEQLREEEAKQ